MLNSWNLYNLAFAMANIAYEHFNALECELWHKHRHDADGMPPQSYWDVVALKRDAQDACGEVMSLYLKG